MADQVDIPACDLDNDSTPQDDLRFVVLLLIPFDGLRKLLDGVSCTVALTCGDSATTYGVLDESDTDAEDVLPRTMNMRADTVQFPKGPFHWAAFEYELYRPNLVCIASEVNDATLEKWKDLPLNARVVVTRGPLEEYKPHGCDIIEDLRLFAYSVQPPEVEIPANAIPYRKRSPTVWFCNRVYRKKDFVARRDR